MSGTISDPAELIYKRARIMDKRSEFDQAARKLYDENDFKSMREFQRDPRYLGLLRAYHDDLDSVYNEKVDFTKARTAGSGAPAKAGRPTDLINEYKTKNVCFKVYPLNIYNQPQYAGLKKNNMKDLTVISKYITIREGLIGCWVNTHLLNRNLFSKPITNTIMGVTDIFFANGKNLEI